MTDKYEEKAELLGDGRIKFNMIEKSPMKTGLKHVGYKTQDVEVIVTEKDLQQGYDTFNELVAKHKKQLSTLEAQREKLGKLVKMTPQLKKLSRDLNALQRHGEQTKLDAQIFEKKEELKRAQTYLDVRGDIMNRVKHEKTKVSSS